MTSQEIQQEGLLNTSKVVQECVIISYSDSNKCANHTEQIGYQEIQRQIDSSDTKVHCNIMTYNTT